MFELRGARAITEPQPATYTPININIVGSLEDTGNRFIETPILYGKTKFSASNSNLFRVDVKGLVVNVLSPYWKRLKEKGIETENPDHSFFKYLKVGGRYVFTNSDLLSGKVEYRYYKELKEAEESCNNITKEVETLIERCIPKFLGKLDAAQVQKDLGVILHSVQSLQVKQKDISSKSAAQNLITKLQKTIDNFLESE